MCINPITRNFKGFEELFLATYTEKANLYITWDINSHVENINDVKSVSTHDGGYTLDLVITRCNGNLGKRNCLRSGKGDA